MPMDSLEEKLRARFGLSTFRPWQREVIEALLQETRPVLVVAPTGGGKSLCYQFPATELPGTTLVISPLIALMVDQVDSLNARGIPATYFASTLDSDERQRRWRGLLAGEFKIVYFAPERLAQERTIELLSQLQCPFVAVDEAHCISQWGHDFRPDYLMLGKVIERLAPKHLLACTATATPRVREEIVERLSGAHGTMVEILRGFARPNLHLSVHELDRASDRMRVARSAIASAIANRGGSAIVYAATRRKAEHAAQNLREWGHRAAVYHAGLDAAERNRVSQAFANGELDAIAATNAFGMGIDRSDIRAVVHLQAPGSIEAYYQEVGRAGRDGAPATGVLLTSSADFGLRRRLIELGADNREEVQRQWGLFLDLLRYVEAGSCRHDFILRYFGDDQELLGGCGHCDVCARLAEARDDASAVDAELVIRKALSGIARAQRRVGLVAVADMLIGRRDRKIERWGLDRLSTFGILGAYERDWTIALLRRLITRNLVELTADEYPIPFLTSRGIAAMKGEIAAQVLLPPTTMSKRRGKKERKNETTASLTSAELEVFAALRGARKRIAAEEELPAFRVFSDRTLVSIASARPKTLAELLAVPGVGPQKLAAYGEQILEVLGQLGGERFSSAHASR